MNPINIVELLQRTALSSPERLFLSDGRRRESYGETWERVQNLARQFRAWGSPGARLLFVGNNSLEYVRAYFAAHLAGHTTVEASPFESPETLQGIVAESRPWGLHTDQPDLAARLGLPLAESLEGPKGQVGPPGIASDARGHGTADLASIVYTSGTTGRPKGVMLSQGNLLAVTDSILDYLKLTADDRYCLVLPLYHTYAKSILHTSVQVAASIRLCDNIKNIAAWLRVLADERITVMGVVPFHIQLLLRWGRLDDYDLSALRTVTVSGAALHPDRITDFCRALPHVRFFFMYGLTESSTRAFYLPPEARERKRGSVGVPIKGVQVAIRDDAGHDLPVGAEGVIHLRGPNIMQGYFNAPEMTADMLRDGWLWTGDVGRLDEDGFLFITGRKKDIINCAGERIAAREIEEALEGHPNVVEAAVLGVPDTLLGESVWAFVVEREAHRDAETLKQWCLQRLSHHKVPRAYRFVEALPKTPSGKVKKALLAASCVG